MKLRKRYFPLVAFSLLALLVSLWAGLSHLGWSIPIISSLTMAHGSLMVCGFLGTLIPLERTVAIRRKWMFAAPILTSLGWVTLLVYPGLGGAVLFSFGSLVMLAILGFMVHQEPKIHTLVMLAGGLARVIGKILWMGGCRSFR